MIRERAGLVKAFFYGGLVVHLLCVVGRTSLAWVYNIHGVC